MKKGKVGKLFRIDYNLDTVQSPTLLKYNECIKVADQEWFVSDPIPDPDPSSKKDSATNPDPDPQHWKLW